jgi:hypothetical protein
MPSRGGVVQSGQPVIPYAISDYAAMFEAPPPHQVLGCEGIARLQNLHSAWQNLHLREHPPCPASEGRIAPVELAEMVPAVH